MFIKNRSMRCDVNEKKDEKNASSDPAQIPFHDMLNILYLSQYDLII